MHLFRHFAVVIGLLVLVLVFPHSATALTYPDLPPIEKEQVSTFSSHININQDTSITITEEIAYQTPVSKHGIYRYIPIKYSRNGLTYTTQINVHSVTDEKNQNIPFEQHIENGNLTLKIGDADKTFTGQQIYKITYTVTEALQRYGDTVELYWDITGEGWQFPIQRTSATIEPGEWIIKGACYAGPVGGDNQKCGQLVADAANAPYIYFYREPITYGDNMTVALQIDPTKITFPPLYLRLWNRYRTQLWLITIPIPLYMMMWLWYTQGRDRMFTLPNAFDQGPRPERTKPLLQNTHIPYVYEPLTLTPGEASTIMTEQFTNQGLVAEIIDLARKKYLKIEPTQKKTWFKDAGYTFTLLKPSDNFLPAHQQYLLDSLFISKDKVTLAELKGSFYTKVETLRNKIFESLTKQGLFAGHPTHVRGAYIGLYAVVMFVSYAWTIIVADWQFINSAIPIAVFWIQAVPAFFITLNMPRKTAKGYNFMLQAQGLKQTIQRGKWREEIKEKHLFIEEVLPFAISLGVIDKLAKDMEDLNMKPPRYLSSTSMTHTNWTSFTHAFTSQVGSSLTYNPSSSSWSSGSGFSGGSSGGGGGGGGGGSW